MMAVRKHSWLAGICLAGIFVTLAGNAPASAADIAAPPATAPTTANVREKRPAIRTALRDLRHAKRALERARDLDGHRDAALKDTDAAIAECEAALESGKSAGKK